MTVETLGYGSSRREGTGREGKGPENLREAHSDFKGRTGRSRRDRKSDVKGTEDVTNYNDNSKVAEEKVTVVEVKECDYNHEENSNI